MELDLDFLTQWSDDAETIETATGLKVALDRDIVRELIERAKRLEKLEAKKKKKKPR